jgi:hypothetical protein
MPILNLPGSRLHARSTLSSHALTDLPTFDMFHFSGSPLVRRKGISSSGSRWTPKERHTRMVEPIRISITEPKGDDTICGR